MDILWNLLIIHQQDSLRGLRKWNDFYSAVDMLFLNVFIGCVLSSMQIVHQARCFRLDLKRKIQLWFWSFLFSKTTQTDIVHQVVFIEFHGFAKKVSESSARFLWKAVVYCQGGGCVCACVCIVRPVIMLWAPWLRIKWHWGWELHTWCTPNHFISSGT